MIDGYCVVDREGDVRRAPAVQSHRHRFRMKRLGTGARLAAGVVQQEIVVAIALEVDAGQRDRSELVARCNGQRAAPRCWRHGLMPREGRTEPPPPPPSGTFARPGGPPAHRFSRSSGCARRQTETAFADFEAVSFQIHAKVTPVCDGRASGRSPPNLGSRDKLEEN